MKHCALTAAVKYEIIEDKVKVEVTVSLTLIPHINP